MTSDPDSVTAEPAARSGRPIRLEPMPPGLWLMIGGAAIAALGPLFGFLLGSMSGQTDADGRFGPLYQWLYAGFVVGAVGFALMLYGVYRFVRTRGPVDAGDLPEPPSADA